MDSFKDREKAFENKFAHDEEMHFKAFARRNKLIGLWAAGVLGKSGAEAESYAMECVYADFKEAGHEDVYRKLAADLSGKMDEAAIRAKMNEFLGIAKEQLLEE